MWIYSDIGFFSIVQKDDYGTLTVRSRVRQDLNRFKKLSPSLKDHEIIESVDSDYRYRLIADKTLIMDCMDELVANIKYENFKEEIGYTEPLRVPLYSAIWGITMRIEELDISEEE